MRLLKNDGGFKRSPIIGSSTLENTYYAVQSQKARLPIVEVENMRKKDILYVSFNDAIKAGGCPICVYLDRAQRGSIESILYEHVNDVEIRKKLIKSLGLCSYHAWLMISIALENPLYGKLGPAIIYEHMLREYINHLGGKFLAFEEVNSKCFLCRDLFKSEKEAISIFAERVETTDLLDRYSKNKSSVLCYRHYAAVVKTLSSEVLKRKLAEIQRRKIELILRSLGSFIEKHDYRRKKPFTPEELFSLQLAVEALKGKPIITNYNHVFLILRLGQERVNFLNLYKKFRRKLKF